MSNELPAAEDDLARVERVLRRWQASRGPIGPESEWAMNDIAGVFLERDAIRARLQ